MSEHPEADSGTCSKCGTKADEQTKFCSTCGAALHQVCPTCGRAIDQATLFCSNCGATLREVFSSPRTQARWTSILLCAMALVAVASMVSGILEITGSHKVTPGYWERSQGIISRSDTHDTALWVAYFISFIGVATSFCLWIHRASQNLRSLGHEGQRFSPAWAVGWWFVPVMWFFRPYQVMREIWQGSYPPPANDDEKHGWRNHPVTTLLGWWWALSICSVAFMFQPFGRRFDTGEIRVYEEVVY